MRNLDELSHDMEFTIGGEVFVVHNIDPSVIEKWEAQETEESLIAQLDERIQTFLAGDQDAIKRWKALRARKGADIVPAWKLIEFHNQLMETQTGRPTPPPSP